MRNFSKKLAFVLAAAMVFTAFAPAAKADAAEKEMAMNRATQTLYVNEGVNDKGAETLADGLYGNVQEYDFYVKNKPADYAKEYNFLWESDNEKVATVDQKGLTKAVAVGTATITCTITDKATDDEVAVAEAKVTVKANAADVVITNAEDYDTLPVPEDGVVDLNRAMYDENGTMTTKRGQVVTDYTRWIAEDADGKAVAATVVAIDQATGKFTFAADAPAGDYTLYCQTYQSDKYNQTTAESEKVVVTVVDEKVEFEAEQTTLDTFVIKFSKAVESVAGVEVIQLIETADNKYEFPQVVNTVKLNDAKTEATVTMFSKFVDSYKYTVKVTGLEAEDTFTASAGAPDSMLISGKADEMGYPFVTVGATQKNLYFRLYDVKGIDVTNNYAESSVVYTEKTYSEDAKYSVAGNVLWIANAGDQATIIAEFQSGKYDENGEPIGNVKKEFTFIGKDADKAYVQGVPSASVVVGGNDTKALNVPYGTEGAYLQIKVKVSGVNDPYTINQNNQEIPNIGYITFEETNPNKVAINKTASANPTLYLFNEGIAQVVVNLNTTNADGTIKTTPIYAFGVNVQPARGLASVTVDKPSVTVGTVDGLDEETIKVSTKDQYTGDCPASISVEATNANSKKLVNEDKSLKGITVEGNEIKIDGSVLGDIFAELTNANVANLSYKVKATSNNVTKETSFTVVVKKPVTGSVSYALEATGNVFGNIGRYLTANDGNTNTENAKVLTVSAYEMSNGIKKATQNIAKAPGTLTADDTTEATGLYYVKVTKNGNDITKDVDVEGNAVTIEFSTIEDKTVSVDGVTGSAVKYNLGAGNYVVTLYKCEMQGTKAVLRQVRALTGTATCDVKSYSLVTRVAEEADSAADADLFKCFKFKDINGTDVANTATNYVVNTQGNAGSGYVYVKSVTFYDDLGGQFAGYDVPVGVSVKIKAAE